MAHQTQAPASTEQGTEEAEWECISGAYFKNGKHVPLDERPEEKVGGLERAFLGKEGIHDVTFSASLVSVYATGWELEEVQEILAEATDEDIWFDHRGTVDNNLKKNIPKEADTVYMLSMEVSRR